MLAIAMTLPVASADVSNDTIRAFNQALESGDGPQIIEASKDLAAAAVANPDQDQSVLFAFEAANQLCTLGQCPEAVAASGFIASAPITDPTEHPIAEDRMLLDAFSNWSANSTRAKRRDLDAALERVVSLQPTTLSIKAFEARYYSDHTGGKVRQAAKSAGQAGDHIRPVAEQVPSAYVTAEYLAAISTFNSSQHANAQRDMTHLQGWLGQYEAKFGEDTPEWISKQYFNAFAWRLAMSAWFQSTGNGGVSDSETETILAGYQTAAPEPEGHADADQMTVSGLPFCEGQMNQTPKLRYRAGQGQRGFYGAVIARFDIESGRVVNPVVKASVPVDEFDEQALKSISQWTWEAAAGQIPGENCGMDRIGVVLPLVFQLD